MDSSLLIDFVSYAFTPLTVPECLDDFIAEDNTVHAVDAAISELDMPMLGFEGACPALTGRPSHHPAFSSE